MEVTVSGSFWGPEWTILRNLLAVTQFYWKEPVVPPFLNSSVFSYVLWFFFFLLSFLCLSISGASAGDDVCPCLNYLGQDDRRKEWVKHDGVSFCWFKDPEAEGKRELENDRIRESELEGVILESFHSWLEVPTLDSKFLSPVWYLYWGGGSFYYKWYKVQFRLG